MSNERDALGKLLFTLPVSDRAADTAPEIMTLCDEAAEVILECGYRKDQDIAEQLEHLVDAVMAIAEGCQWRSTQNQRNIENGIYDETMTEVAKYVSSFASVTAEKLRAVLADVLEPQP